MINALYWLLAIELVGLIAFPVAFALLPRLADRGYSVAKPLGLVLISWLLWILGSLHLVPTTIYTLWGALGLFALASGWYAYHHRDEMLALMRRERRTILVGEGVFLLLYLVWVLYRAYDPSINTTEQPMDFAFLNASSLASYFPPEDPWLRGSDLPYYYFGYLMMGNLMELTSIPSQISYNLALALIPAMAGAAAFGLVYSLIRIHGGTASRGVAFALLAPVFLLVVSNMEGVMEFVRLRQWGTESFWDWVGIKDLGPAQSLSWRPNDYLWWWRGTRVIDSFGPTGAGLDYTITEFPYFSFLLGDLHPHVMSIPFILLFVSYSMNFFLTPVTLGKRWVRDNLPTVFAASLLLGALAFINIWDIVPFAVLWSALLLFKGAHQERGDWLKGLSLAWLPALATLALALILYLPFYSSLESQASGIFFVGEVATRPVHFLVIWGLFLVVVLPFLLLQAPQTFYKGMDKNSWMCAGCGHMNSAEADFCAECGGTSFVSREFWPRASVALVILFSSFFAWASWQLGWNTLGFGSADPISVVLERFLNTLPLALLLFVALYCLIRRAEDGNSPAIIFVLAMISLALLLIMGPEFLRLDDLFHNRMNTIFKLYYQAWIILAIASAFGLYFLSLAIQSTKGVYRLAMGGAVSLIGVLFLASLYYPVEAAFTKGGQFRGDVTLDGLAYVARDSQDEYDAIRWLQNNGREGEGVLEAVGDSWSAYSRISFSTGLPTVLGWPWHEHQWRGSPKPFEGREEDVRTIYATQDIAEATRLLEEYDIQYVVVGPRERSKYGTQGLSKFSQMGEVVFPGKDMNIYRVSQ